MSYTEDTAQDIAMKALEEAEISGNPKIVDQIGEMMGAIRVRRSEKRAREMLAEAAAKRLAEAASEASDPKPASESP